MHAPDHNDPNALLAALRGLVQEAPDGLWWLRLQTLTSRLQVLDPELAAVARDYVRDHAARLAAPWRGRDLFTLTPEQLAQEALAEVLGTWPEPESTDAVKALLRRARARVDALYGYTTALRWVVHDGRFDEEPCVMAVLNTPRLSKVFGVDPRRLLRSPPRSLGAFAKMALRYGPGLIEGVQDSVELLQRAVRDPSSDLGVVWLVRHPRTQRITSQHLRNVAGDPSSYNRAEGSRDVAAQLVRACPALSFPLDLDALADLIRRDLWADTTRRPTYGGTPVAHPRALSWDTTRVLLDSEGGPRVLPRSAAR